MEIGKRWWGGGQTLLFVGCARKMLSCNPWNEKASKYELLRCLPVSNGPKPPSVSSDFWQHSWKFSRYAVTQDTASAASSFKLAIDGVCWGRFWLVLLKITWLLPLVAGKYSTPRRVCSHRLQRSRLRVMSYIHPSWPPTERSSLFHSAFALLNSKDVFFFLPGKQREVEFTDFIDFPIFKPIWGSLFKCGVNTYSALLHPLVLSESSDRRLPPDEQRWRKEIIKWGEKWNMSGQGWREKREKSLKRW